MYRASLAVILLAASTGVATAGGYIGLGIGNDPAVSEDTNTLSADGRSGKLLLGSRFGKLSVEAAIGSFDVASSGATFDVYQGSVAGKLNLPLGDGFEVFGRLGLQRTWLRRQDVDEIYDASGSGHLIGAGVEYRLDLGLGSTSIWFDYQYNHAELDGERTKGDFNTRMWTLGLTVGI